MYLQSFIFVIEAVATATVPDDNFGIFVLKTYVAHTRLLVIQPNTFGKL